MGNGVGPDVVGNAQGAPVVARIPHCAQAHGLGRDRLVVLVHVLRYDLSTPVVHQLVGLGEILSGEAVLVRALDPLAEDGAARPKRATKGGAR